MASQITGISIIIQAYIKDKNQSSAPGLAICEVKSTDDPERWIPSIKSQ